MRRIMGLALIPVLVVLALPSVVRLLGDHGWPPLVVLSVVTPYALPPLVILLAVFAILSRGVLAGVAGALVLLNVVWLAPLFVGSSTPAGTNLTVVTANLHLGGADPVAVVDLVRREHADVLAAEELTPAEATALARAGLKSVLPYRVLETGSGATGNGLYSRYPLTRLPVLPLTFPGPGAQLRVNGTEVLVRVVHVYPPVPWRASASRGDWAALRHAAAALPSNQPVIVAGDFNATRDVAGFRAVMRQGLGDAPEISGAGLLRTWGPAHLPALLQLDHVLVNSRLGVRGTSAVDLPGSDHQALVARLVVKAG